MFLMRPFFYVSPKGVHVKSISSHHETRVCAKQCIPNFPKTYTRAGLFLRVQTGMVANLEPYDWCLRSSTQ